MGIPLRVLFVEDMEEDAELLRRELKRGGFDPDWLRVDTAQAMAKALQESKWDIVISDYSMPTFSGIAALELIKQGDEHIPFIIVSGTIGEQTAVEAMKAGAQDYFLKNSIARLPIAVERELREASARRKQRANATALGEIQARFHAFMNNAPMPAWIKDADLRYIYVNPAQSNFFGIAAQGMIGLNDFDLMSYGSAQASQTHDRAVIALGKEMNTQETIMDGKHRAKTLDVIRFPLPSGEGRSFVAGLAVDVSERVKSQKDLEMAVHRLQILSSRVIEVQERERQHLARGLHDDVGQTLTALKISIESVMKSQPETATALQSSVDIVASILAQVRSLSLDLRPPQLDNLGLVAALRWYVESKASSSNIKGWFESDALSCTIHPDIENTCFRIVQEAVTNILRHAHAKNIWVKISEPRGQIMVTIKDDGRGFDIEGARTNAIMGTSFGLLNMEERAVLVGGSMEMSSQEGKGVEIVMLLPVSPIMKSE